MLTALLIFWPLIAGFLVVFSSNEKAKTTAFVCAILELLIGVGAIIAFKQQPTLLSVDRWWIQTFGISFHVGMDGISLLLVLLTVFLTPLIILSTFDHTYKNAAAFYGLILFMEMALVGVFVSMDGFLFYIFWELALIPIYFICLLWGGKDRVRITFKFFLYTLVGSLFMLVGLIYLYLHTGKGSFNINDLYVAGSSLSAVEQSWVFWSIFIAFAIKMPIFPFHTWQPATYAESPNAGTMLLSGIMLKMGLYGVIRWLIPVVPGGSMEWMNVVMILCVIGVVYGSCLAIVQKDFRRLIAYSSIAHVGLIAAGIFTWNEQGLQGAIIQMLSHGINVVALFFIADIITRRTNTRLIPELGGIRGVAPVFATLFMIVMLGAVALPMTNGFVGEFLLLNGVYQYNANMAAVAGLTIILGAVYMLRSYQGVMLGETNSVTKAFPDLTFNEKAVLIPIVILVIAMGVYPKPILDISEPAVAKLVSLYKVTH
jgi:NADH-quinone oxidoreductase subunit M